MTLQKRKKATETSHKKSSEGKQVHVGMEASKNNQTRWESMTPQHFLFIIFFYLWKQVYTTAKVTRR